MLGEKLQKAVLEAEGEPSLAKCAMNAESLGEFIATDTTHAVWTLASVTTVIYRSREHASAIRPNCLSAIIVPEIG